MSHSSSPVTTSLHDPVMAMLFVCVQGFMGLVFGGFTALVLSGLDPFGVEAFLLPQSAGDVQAASAYEEWKNRPGEIIGGLAMTLVPLTGVGVVWSVRS